MAVLPKKSASVILLRDTAHGVETFLIQRHTGSSFMGGLYAFPGGNVEGEDSSEELLAHAEWISKEEAWAVLGKGSSPQIALAHWVTGIREVFEEAGVLFAINGGGTLISFEDEKRRKRFERYRELINRGAMPFAEIFYKEDLSIASSSLIHYAHWITPEDRSRRYDTYFFLAQLPMGQTAAADHVETIRGIWLKPVAALAGNVSGKIPLTPPALCILQGLSSFCTVEELLEYSKTRDMTDPIVPIIANIKGQEIILMPGDELYAEYGGKKEEHYKNPHQSIRLIRKEGRWLPAIPSRSDT